MAAALVLIFIVAVGAFLLRRFSRSSEDEYPGMSGPTPAPSEPAIEDELDLDDPTALEAVAVTSEGWSLVPFEDGVRLVRPRQELAAGGMETPAGQTGAPAPWEQVEGLRLGDLIGARVRHASYGESGWVLEALGRDLDYCAWSFETQDAAEAGRALLERRVVRAPLDLDGEPMPPSDADFDAALKQSSETAQELAMMPEEEGSPGNE